MISLMASVAALLVSGVRLDPIDRGANETVRDSLSTGRRFKYGTLK